MSAHDEEMFVWVRWFNRRDLYSKGAARPKVEELRPFYEDLIAAFFPDKIDWQVISPSPNSRRAARSQDWFTNRLPPDRRFPARSDIRTPTPDSVWALPVPWQQERGWERRKHRRGWWRRDILRSPSRSAWWWECFSRAGPCR